MFHKCNRDVTKNIISTSSTMKDAIDIIDSTYFGIALVTDEQKKFVGLITDGDVRRAVMKNFSLNDSVLLSMNKNPQFIYHPYTKEQVKAIFDDHPLVIQIPILNNIGNIVDVLIRHEYELNLKTKKTAVIMAGGEGSRLKELTKNTPKPLLPIGDKPLIETIYNVLIKNGFERIFITVNYKSDLIIEHFKKMGTDVQFLTERKKLGTAGSLAMLKDSLNLVNSPIVIINGDILTNIDFKKLLFDHCQSNSEFTISVKQIDVEIPYGIVNAREDLSLISLDEKPKKSIFINAGVYCVNSDIIELIDDNTYFDMTDLIKKILSMNKKINVFPIREYWLDIGMTQDYKKAQLDYLEYFCDKSNIDKNNDLTFKST
ncbi:MAG: NTP transferase domain-containing protein [Oligoflexia bacterium]|nr:NTP transferase domain-containing protein [Oligoflexia bacterium]